MPFRRGQRHLEVLLGLSWILLWLRGGWLGRGRVFVGEFIEEIKIHR